MEQEDLNLIKKYLNGEATPSEAAYVRELLSQHLIDDDDLTRQLLLEEWENTPSDNQSGIDINEAWNEFAQKVIKQVPQTEKPVRTMWKRLLVAASFAAILASATIYFSFFQSAEQQTVLAKEITYTIKSTGQGEKLNISFPDGSFIRLNSSTRLEIPSNYSSERIVYLDGEAFFEIQRIEDKPFRVITGEVTTEVLGTAFNVNTFSANEVSVAVVEGKVRVYNNNNSIELNPEETTIVGPLTQEFTKSKFDLEPVAGWRNNILVFDKVTFAEMIERLKQWYGVEFIIEGNSSPKGLYSGRFENKSLQLVLEGLGFSSEFEYKIVDKEVFLKFN